MNNLDGDQGLMIHLLNGLWSVNWGASETSSMNYSVDIWLNDFRQNFPNLSSEKKMGLLNFYANFMHLEMGESSEELNEITEDLLFLDRTNLIITLKGYVTADQGEHALSVAVMHGANHRGYF